jgi:hypothetical protein
MRAAKARQLLIEGALLRSLRLLPVGQEAPYLEEDRKILEHVRMTDTPLVYLNPCPKKGNSQARTRYLKYMHAKSNSQARKLGATTIFYGTIVGVTLFIQNLNPIYQGTFIVVTIVL